MTDNLRFKQLNEAIKPMLFHLIPQILPQGKRQGLYWVALSPTRYDRKAGSFKINLHTGLWADFATGDRGSDATSLVAYLYGLRQGEAAIYLETIAGIAANDN